MGVFWLSSVAQKSYKILLSNLVYHTVCPIKIILCNRLLSVWVMVSAVSTVYEKRLMHMNVDPPSGPDAVTKRKLMIM